MLAFRPAALWLPFLCLAAWGQAQTSTPALIVKPDQLFFRQSGSTPPASQTAAVTVKKGTLGPLTVAVSGGAWLTAKASGAAVAVSVGTAGLASGDYGGSVAISAFGFTSATLKVNLTILGANVVSSPEALTFQAVVGGDANPAKIVNIFTRNGAGFGWNALVDQPWLTINPPFGAGKSGLEVSVDPTQVSAAGTYTGHVTVTDVNNSTTDTVTVTFTANPPEPPDFELGPYLFQPGEIFWTVDGNTATPAPRIFYGRNVGGNGPNGAGSLSFSLTDGINSPAGGNWLTLTPATNTTPGKTTATASPAGLAPGIYSATVSGVAQEPAGAIGGNLDSTLLANLTVLSDPNVFVDRSFVAFTASTKQNPPAPTPAVQTVDFITRSATGYPFSSTVTTGGGGNWLSVSPANGTAVGGGSVAISILPAAIANLTPGYYSGQVQLNFAGGAPVSEHTITVGLRIYGGTDGSLLDVTPGGMVFVATAGGSNPASRNVRLWAEGAAATGFTYTVAASVSAPAGGSWLGAGSSGGTATAAVSSVPVNVNIAGLTPGIYKGTLSFNPDPSTGAPNQIVNVNLIVNATAAQPAGPLVATIDDPADNFVTSTGSALNLGVVLTDSTGSPVPGASVVLGSSNGEPDVTLNDLGNGSYSGSFQPRQSGTVTLSVTADAVDGSGHDFSASPVALTGDVESDGAAPMYTNGAVSAATFAPQPAPLAPGQMISLFGYNMLTSAGQASIVPLPLSLGGTSVTIGGIAAPLFATYPASAPGLNDQINLQLPYELAGQATADIVVTNNGISGPPQTIAIGLAPAFFTTSGYGSGDGSFVHSDGVTLITPANPAAIGEGVTLYCTGLGPLQTPVPSGTADLGIDRIAGTVAITIGGVPATPGYAGAAPYSVGENQINLTIPPGVPSGENVVTLSVNGIPTTGHVTIAVQ